MSAEFDQILKQLQKITNENFSREFFLSSLTKTINLKELNVEQQKNLLNYAMDKEGTGPETFLELNYNIIKNNIVAGLTEEEIQNLTIYDRIFISLALRSISNNQLTISYKTKETQEKKYKTFSIKEIIEKYSLVYPDLLKNKTIYYKSEDTHKPTIFTFELKLPLISEEIQTNKQFNSNTQDFSGDIFISEMIKYVDCVSVDNLNVKFKDLSIDQKTNLIKSLPAQAANPVIVEINSIKKRLYDSLTLNWIDEVSGENVFFEIDINSEWFLNY